MDIKPAADILKESDLWFEQWHAERNAKVAALDSVDPAQNRDSLTRGEWDDEQMRWFFKCFHRPILTKHSQRMSPDAHLYDLVTQCMKAARDNERKRLSARVSVFLETLLGDDFTSVIFDICDKHDINTGYD